MGNRAIEEFYYDAASSVFDLSNECWSPPLKFVVPKCGYTQEKSSLLINVSPQFPTPSFRNYQNKIFRDMLCLECLHIRSIRSICNEVYSRPLLAVLSILNSLLLKDTWLNIIPS